MIHLLLVLLATPVPPPVIGDISLADVTANDMDGCGMTLARAQMWRSDNFDGPFIYDDDEDSAIVRIDGKIVRLKLTGKGRDPLVPAAARNAFTNADHSVTVWANTHVTKTVGGADSELWYVAGTLTIKAKGTTQTFAVKGSGGC
jgi:hypothetical protein